MLDQNNLANNKKYILLEFRSDDLVGIRISFY